MKNITALTALVTIIISLSAINAAWCQEENSERNYAFSLGTQFGFVHGMALEYVYPTDTKGELLSELTWGMKPVFYYGFQFDLSRIDLMSSPGFFASASLKVGIPGDSGVMEDRDWMSTENDDLTHFSHHTNKTREFLWLDAAVGASIPVRSLFYLKPFISGSWMHFSFTGRDGYGEYPSETTSFEGMEVIRYKQDWFLIATGLSVGTDLFSPFSFNLSFQMSPLTYCAAMDEHLVPSPTTFLDFTYWGLFIEPGASVSFTLNRFEFSFEFAFRYIGRTRGESLKKSDVSEYYFSNGEAGAGLSLSRSSLFVRLRI